MGISLEQAAVKITKTLTYDVDYFWITWKHNLITE